MAAVVESSIDVALWLLDRAMDHNEYLQPQKLHRLLYLAQGYFAVAYEGRMLMPTVFVADPLGPVEPTIFRVFATQFPVVERKPLPEIANKFLDVLWRRFGHHSTEHLNKVVAAHPPFLNALAMGERSIITLQSMTDFLGKKAASERTGTPAAASFAPPRLMRTQSGEAVSVKKWTPAVKKGA